MPYQFGLSTRAGTEALYKLLQVATALAPPSSQSMRLGHSIMYPVRPCSKGCARDLSLPRCCPVRPPFLRQREQLRVDRRRRRRA